MSDLDELPNLPMVCRIAATVVSRPAVGVPSHQRGAFGWPVVAVTQGDALRVVFDDLRAAGGRPVHLRLSVGVDIRWRAKLRVSSGALLVGLIDIRYATAGQTYDLPVEAGVLDCIGRDGIDVRLEEPTGGGEVAVFLLAPGVPVAGFRPHLLVDVEPVSRLTALRRCIASGESLTQYGWMEGCVLDALSDLGEWNVLDAHLDQFFPPGGIVYEDFYSRPGDGRIEGTETTNMIAVLARRRGEHPAVGGFLEMTARLTKTDGDIREYGSVAEHAYTIAYPLATIAALGNDKSLAMLALRQLEIRAGRLRTAGTIWLRHHEDGSRTFGNWSRGCAWYLLGFVRTLGELLRGGFGVPEAMVAEVREAAGLVLGRQREDGLWPVFLDEPDSPVETSGSAGMAAALALAANHGWLDGSFTAAAGRTLVGLEAYVTADGMLGGMSQANKSQGKEDLQRSSHRVLGRCAMGLAGQLMAALQDGGSMGAYVEL